MRREYSWGTKKDGIDIETIDIETIDIETIDIETIDIETMERDEEDVSKQRDRLIEYRQRRCE